MYNNLCNSAYGKDNVKKSTKKSKRMSVYANLANKRRTKKDASARKRAEYLATLPKHPVKRFFYRLHPKRVAAYWFSKRGLFMALKIAGVSVLLMVLFVGGLFAYFRKDLDKIRPGEIAKRVQTWPPPITPLSSGTGQRCGRGSARNPTPARTHQPNHA